MTFTSTVINLGAGMCIDLKKHTKEGQTETFLNILATACYNIHNYAAQMHAKGFDQDMVKDMAKLLKVASILGMKWEARQQGNNNIDIDLKFFNLDGDESQ